MATRQQIIDEAVALVETLKARGATHGQGDTNFIVLAGLLNACGYRRIGVNETAQFALTPIDACLFYEVSKIARIICGDRLEPDHHIDTAGYAIIAAAIVRSLKE